MESRPRFQGVGDSGGTLVTTDAEDAVDNYATSVTARSSA